MIDYFQGGYKKTPVSKTKFKKITLFVKKEQNGLNAFEDQISLQGAGETPVIIPLFRRNVQKIKLKKIVKPASKKKIVVKSKLESNTNKSKTKKIKQKVNNNLALRIQSINQ